MKRLLFYIMCCFFAVTAAKAQNDFGNDMPMNNPNANRSDTANSQRVVVPVEVHQWHIDERFGRVTEVTPDTVQHLYQNTTLTEGMNGEYNHLGNQGSPRLSRIFFDRDETSETFFIQPFNMFVKKPNELFFTNTKSPFSNLTYLWSGDKSTGEDLFKAYFATNINKRLNVGFLIDYMYGRGYYNSQSTSLFNGTLFASYRGDHYGMHLIGSRYHIKMAENGGIKDDTYITDPADKSKKVSTTQIPTWLDNTWNRNDLYSVFLTQHYNIGFHREKIVDKNALMKNGKTSNVAERIVPKSKKDSLTINKNDTILREFIPVTSVLHTIKLESNDHKFIGYETPANYYENTYLPNDTIRDQVKYLGIKNTFGLQLCEGFNKWVQSGLIAYASHEYRNFELSDSIADTTPLQQKRTSYSENLISIGAELSRQQGKAFHYRLLGETTLTGATGQFRVEGNADFNFKFLGDSIRLQASGFVKNLQPVFMLRHYHSQHLWWDNDDLSKEMRTRIEGELSAKKLGTTIRVGVENIKNYTYLGMNGTSYTEGSNTYWRQNVGVNQTSDNIQVINATLKQNFKLGILHWDTEVTYQKSSNEDVLPLPDLSLFSNLYIQAWLVKNVLRTELGADVTYFTKYYAPDYSPAIQNFALQNAENKIEIGNYPILNAYINFQWKRTRFYVMYYHANKGSGSNNYFLAPHYPINPSLLKLGISWNFYN